MATIVTLTMNPTIDESSALDSVAAEIKMRCDPPRYEPGGGGINVSRAVVKLGGASTAVYTAGGHTGRLLQRLLTEEGIDHHPVHIAGTTRENFIIYERSSGLQYRFGMPGPELTADEWLRCLDAVFEHEADYLVASGSLPPGVMDDFYAHVAQRARERGTRLIVDTSGPALEKAVRAGVFLLKPNISELEAFVGQPIQSRSHLREVTRALIAEGQAEAVVVSLGAGGAVFVAPGVFVQLQAPIVPVQSKVGAGDSMVGGIVTALAAGRDLMDAVRYGIAAGTAAVMTPGTELCRLEDTERLYRETSLQND